MKPTRFLVILSTVGILTMLPACGGGGGGGTGRMPDSRPAASTLADIQTANPNATRMAGERAADNLPRFGSVTQSSNGGSVAGVSGDAASTSFNGRDVRLTIRRRDGSRLAFNSAAHRIGSQSFAPVLPGYSLRRDALLTHDHSSASAAAVTINWNNTDPTDYLAGGYWMHLEGRTDPLIITGAEIGAFVDGPELSSAPTLPNLGTATYSGNAGGLFVFQNLSAARQSVGRISADARLTADFSSRTISGCIGCGGLSISGIAAYADGREQTFTDLTYPIRLRLGATSFGANGAFRNRNVRVERNDATVTSTSGSWGGQFSKIPTAAGDPRLVAGTAGAKWRESDGSQGIVVGAWFGTRN